VKDGETIMQRTAWQKCLRRFGWAGLAAILGLCPVLLAPATPMQVPKPDENKKASDEAKSEIKPDQRRETQPRFTLRGQLVQGVLLQRQEDLRNLAYLSFQTKGAQPQDYQVSIDWGDDTEVTRGQLLDAGSTFMVAGRHTYAATGRYSLGICVTGPDGRTAVVHSVVEVGDLFAGMAEDWTAATFAGPEPSAAIDDCQATIDWGDGSPCAAGLVSRSGEVFRVHGSHAYALDGRYTVRVLVTDANGLRLSQTRRIRVVRPQVTAKFIYVRGKPGEACTNIEVATLQVANRLAGPREYSALIDWGDGTPFDADAVIVGSRGEFRVFGSHTYRAPGSFLIRVFLLQTWH
jgi:hypothetical protein